MRLWHAVVYGVLFFGVFTLGARFWWGVPISWIPWKGPPAYQWSWRTCVAWGLLAGIALGTIVYIKNA